LKFIMTHIEYIIYIGNIAIATYLFAK